MIFDWFQVDYQFKTCSKQCYSYERLISYQCNYTFDEIMYDNRIRSMPVDLKQNKIYI